jgi:flagellar hook-basal body complex protein FliE
MKLSEITSSLSGVNKNALFDSIGLKTDVSPDAGKSETFSSLLKESLDEVNKSQVNAYGAMNEIATGKVENLQEAVQKIEEAELSLKLGLEVKNKALGAYKQIMAMQV